MNKCLVCKNKDLYGFIEIIDKDKKIDKAAFCKNHYEMIINRLKELDSKDNKHWLYAPKDILATIIAELR